MHAGGVLAASARFLVLYFFSIVLDAYVTAAPLLLLACAS